MKRLLTVSVLSVSLGFGVGSHYQQESLADAVYANYKAHKYNTGSRHIINEFEKRGKGVVELEKLLSIAYDIAERAEKDGEWSRMIKLLDWMGRIEVQLKNGNFNNVVRQEKVREKLIAQLVKYGRSWRNLESAARKDWQRKYGIKLTPEPNKNKSP